MHIMRPDIDQLVKTLFGGKGNYIPLMELGIHPEIKRQFLGREIYSLSDDVDFWHQAGYDYIKIQPKADFHVPGYIADESITNSIKWAPQSNGTITCWEEFEKFKFTTPQEIDFSSFELIREMLPPGMGVIGQYGDIFTMTWELMGFENFSYALFENSDLISAIMNQIGDTVYSMFEYFAQNDIVDALWYSDDIAYITGLMLSPDDLRKYFFPWLKKIGDLAKEYEKPLIYHSDGKLWDVFPDIIDCGVNALHPIEPKAMDIFKVKSFVGSQLCLIGNIEVGDILSLGTPKNVREAVMFNMGHLGPLGGYCIGSGNSIPNYVKYENYIALIDTAKNYK